MKMTELKPCPFCSGEMVDGKWQPNKEGLGLGKVLDYIGVKYDFASDINVGTNEKGE